MIIKKQTKKEKLIYVFIIILIIFNIFIWFYGRNSSSGLLSVYFLDVGQGDSIFIEAPNGNQMMIDGGRNPSVLNELSKFMRLSDKTIDVVLATHPDTDHIGGLPEIFDRYDIFNFVDTGKESDSNFYRQLILNAEKENSNYIKGERGLVVVLDKTNHVYLQVLSPQSNFTFPDVNNSSIVARLVYGERSFMLTGDASKAIENMLVYEDSDILESDVLKVGHHGSKTSSSLLFLEKVKPKVSIISASKNNTYGHPNVGVLENLNSINSTILETSKEGTIVFQTDGVNLWRK